MQLLYLHYFISSTFPQTFSEILIGMKIATLSWLPNILTGVVPELARSSTIPPKIIDVLGDYLFSRNGGYFYIVLALVVVTFAVLKILSIPEINRNKASRMWCQ